jgi:hypothetical protein
MLHKLRTFARLPGETRTLIIEACLALALGALLAEMPLRWYARWLGARDTEHPAEAHDALTSERVRQIGWAIRLIAGRVPFRSNCLPQAIAARALLGRRGLPITIYFGAAFTSPAGEALKAHAWSRSGAVTLTGSKPRRQFHIVARFTHTAKVQDA